MPLGKLNSFGNAISRKSSENQQKKLRNDVIHVRTSKFAKNKLDPAKNETSDIRLFCTKKRFNTAGLT